MNDIAWLMIGGPAHGQTRNCHRESTRINVELEDRPLTGQPHRDRTYRLVSYRCEVWVKDHCCYPVAFLDATPAQMNELPKMLQRVAPFGFRDIDNLRRTR